MCLLSLKKHLTSNDKDKICDFVFEMYKNSTSAREYIDHFLTPDIGADVLDQYKKIIEREFYPKNPEQAGVKYSVEKKSYQGFCRITS